MYHLLRALSLLVLAVAIALQLIGRWAVWSWRQIVRVFTDELPEVGVNDAWFDSHLDMGPELQEFESHRRLMARPLWIGAGVVTFGILVGAVLINNAPGIGEPHPDSIVDTGHTSISVERPHPFTTPSFE